MTDEIVKKLSKFTKKQGWNYTEAEVAKALRISRKTLQRYRRDGIGPPYIRVGRSIRYPEPELKVWLTERTHK